MSQAGRRYLRSPAKLRVTPGLRLKTLGKETGAGGGGWRPPRCCLLDGQGNPIWVLAPGLLFTGFPPSLLSL